MIDLILDYGLYFTKLCRRLVILGEGVIIECTNFEGVFGYNTR